MSSDLYLKKYLKYKRKYKNLVIQNGGTKINIGLIVQLLQANVPILTPLIIDQLSTSDSNKKHMKSGLWILEQVITLLKLRTAAGSMFA